jgi:hypothetical protein
MKITLSQKEIELILGALDTHECELIEQDDFRGNPMDAVYNREEIKSLKELMNKLVSHLDTPKRD